MLACYASQQEGQRLNKVGEPNQVVLSRICTLYSLKKEWDKPDDSLASHSSYHQVFINPTSKIISSHSASNLNLLKTTLTPKYKVEEGKATISGK